MLLHICRKPIAKIEKLRCNGQKNVKSGNDFIPETRPENRQSQNNKKRSLPVIVTRRLSLMKVGSLLLSRIVLQYHRRRRA
jgi:hypothetical protein